MLDFLLKSNVFITIISGTFVFIISQYYLEMYLKPRRKLYDKYARISELMLQKHAQYINGTLNPEDAFEIKKAASELLSVGWQLYSKRKKKRLLFLEISKEINGIISNSMMEKPRYEQIQESIKKIERLDKNIKITYQLFEEKSK